ncbi:NHLP leader peptide family RiPP precursor [Paenibacillus sp. PL2-23]|uniref:NHLP leader peptide family RiPP precursor n=1 Tax=Paenibacillus sp. PL2-23 TaxID=2100729 RepID=UPI0030F96B69
MANQQQLREQIIEKAWTDSEFKAKLLADPKGAIEEAFGVKVPDEINLKVLEETNDTFYLVLPQKPADGTDDSVCIPMWD